MKAGDRVRVYPHGKEKLATVGEVVIISENQRSIGVAFRDGAPVALTGAPGMLLLPGLGQILLASREALDGAPWGPWIEFGGGHYEIEEL